MSFSDWMSSARGPGLIGTVLATVVLLGFGVLFVLAFDSRLLGGGPTVESVVSDQAREIETLRERIADQRKPLENLPKLKEAANQLGESRRRVQSQTVELAGLRDQIKAGEAAVKELQAQFDAHKDRYRAKVRAEAKGGTLARLETRDGQVYEDVRIREVTAIGMQILHSAGQKRIPYEELPADLQERFQFDPQQKVAALARESDERAAHESFVDAAQEAQERASESRRSSDAEARRVKTLQTIAAGEARLRSLNQQIQTMELVTIPAEARKTISRAPKLREELAALKREQAALEAQLLRLKSEQ